MVRPAPVQIEIALKSSEFQNETRYQKTPNSGAETSLEMVEPSSAVQKYSKALLKTCFTANFALKYNFYFTAENLQALPR